MRPGDGIVVIEIELGLRTIRCSDFVAVQDVLAVGVLGYGTFGATTATAAATAATATTTAGRFACAFGTCARVVRIGVVRWGGDRSRFSSIDFGRRRQRGCGNGSDDRLGRLGQRSGNQLL